MSIGNPTPLQRVVGNRALVARHATTPTHRDPGGAGIISRLPLRRFGEACHLPSLCAHGSSRHAVCRSCVPRIPAAWYTWPLQKPGAGEGGRLRDAGGIACPIERAAKDRCAGALHHGRLLAKSDREHARSYDTTNAAGSNVGVLS